MDISILSTLIQNINPKAVYEFEFPAGKKETKSGLDWRMTFVSLKKQITNADGKKLIKFFSEAKENLINNSSIKKD